MRVVYFWRDMLANAGIDPAHAFTTHERFTQTLEQLRAAGIPTPWVVETARNNNPVQYAASWMWGQGGEYLSSDGKQVAFTSEQAVTGLHQYFDLLRYYPTHEGLFSEDQACRAFAERKAAVTISGTWLLQKVANTTGRNQDTLSDYIGASLPPGPSFVGGTNLGMMSHLPARLERSILNLCLYLGGEAGQNELATVLNVLPVRRSALARPYYAQDPIRSVFVRALEDGRALPNVARWGLIEERLVDCFMAITSEVFKRGADQTGEIVRQKLKATGNRLNLILMQ